MTTYTGTSGDDKLTGTNASDTFDVFQGGDDRIVAGGGDDWIRFGGALNLDDKVAGGSGFDRLLLMDAGAVTLGSNISGIEYLYWEANTASDNSLVLKDGAFRSADLEGGFLDIEFFLSGGSVSVDAIRETDASMLIVLDGHYSNSLVKGGGGDDTIRTMDGDEAIMGGRGDDQIYVRSGEFDLNDRIDGGDGLDTLTIEDSFPEIELTFASDTLQHIEVIKLSANSTIKLHNGNIGNNQTLTIETAGNLNLDASSEKSGSLIVSCGDADCYVRAGRGADSLLGGSGGDRFLGGSGSDTLVGGGGWDTLTGGGGSDHFQFLAISEIGVSAAEWLTEKITDLKAEDLIDLSEIDADVGRAGNQAFKLVDAFTGKAGQMVLSFDESSKTTFLRLDVDGDGAADGVIQLTGNHTDFTNFIL